MKKQRVFWLDIFTEKKSIHGALIEKLIDKASKNTPADATYNEETFARDQFNSEPIEQYDPNYVDKARLQ